VRGTSSGGRTNARTRLSFFDRVVCLLPAPLALRRAIRLAKMSRTGRAFTLFARAARAGLPEGQYRVGRCYLEGSGVPASLAESMRWLERAATQDHAEAQWLLAAVYIHGAKSDQDRQTGEFAQPRLFSTKQELEPDYAAAEKWARRAAECGSADGQALLAYILTSGPESMRQLEEAHRWYERSARAGCPQGSLGYAQSLARLVDDEQGHREVAEHLRRAAQAGLPTAIYLLGVLTERGIGIKRDQAAAAELYRQAATKGNRSGQASWGRALMWGLGVERNPTAGESWLRRAALAGDPGAATLLGQLYLKQDGSLPPNYAEAAVWFRRAADAGHPIAARTLGLLYLAGSGVARDPKAAANWLRIPAKAGDSQARVDLANLLLRGEVDAHPGELNIARLWLEQAAQSGSLIAAFHYGVCLAEGVGIERDETLAVQWLRRSADGVAGAQYWYGRMLVDGRGVDPDLEGGRAWIARAAAVGIADAEAALAEMMVNGRGGKRDHVAAMALFERAAGKGHVGAMFALGMLRGGGYEVPMDRALAQRWFRAAAERGHIEAQSILGRYLARGLAGDRDPDSACLWLGRAAAQGQADARLELACLGPAPRAEPSTQAEKNPHLNIVRQN
jgi:uncharacterized protein